MVMKFDLRKFIDTSKHFTLKFDTLQRLTCHITCHKMLVTKVNTMLGTRQRVSSMMRWAMSQDQVSGSGRG